MNMIDRILSYFGYVKKGTIEVIERKIPIPPYTIPVRSVVDYISVDYIRGELEKTVKNQSNFLNVIYSEELKLFVQAISKYYRKNAVYDFLYEKGYQWREATVPLKDVYLTRINKETNKYLEKVDFNLLSVVREYEMGAIPKSNELFIFNDKSIEGFMPMCIQNGEKIEIIDGNHRICRMVIEQNKPKYISVYLGEKL